jgi:hypothetical protein
MPSTNISRVGLAPQTLKGTEATAPIVWVNLTGGNMGINPEIETRSETGAGVDVGDRYIRVLAGGGDPSFLLRPLSAPLFYYAIMGGRSSAVTGTTWSSAATYTTGQIIKPTTWAQPGTFAAIGTTTNVFKVVSGTTSGTSEPAWAGVPIGGTVNATAGTAVYENMGPGGNRHTITPANTKPFFTVWFELADSLFLIFKDCKFTSMNMEFAAGGDLTVSTGLISGSYRRVSATVGGGYYDQVYAPLRVPGAVYNIGASPDTSLASGNFNIESAVNPVQTDGITYSYLEDGQREISFGYEGVYVDQQRYAQVYMGSSSGLTPAQTIYEAAMDWSFGGGGQRIKYTLQRALFTEAGAAPDPGANPLMLSVGGAAGRVTSGNICTVEIDNGVQQSLYPAT